VWDGVVSRIDLAAYFEHDYPATPGAKDRSPHSPSIEAAAKTGPRAAHLRTLALHQLNQYPDGLTADECAEKMGASVLAVRPRFSELYRDGLIAKTGRRRLNGSGMSATVWRAVQEARVP
jgi:hypothetical protein